VDDLLAALHFTPFDDAAPALRGARAAGIRLVVVSNWDVSLHDVLARTGLAELVDGAISSAECRAAKPDPAPLRRGLAIAGVGAADAWLVGDTPDADVAGARAAGVTPVLLDRAGTLAPQAAGARVIRSLAELPS
jgi:putative hydrolase of the HAD superfamily